MFRFSVKSIRELADLWQMSTKNAPAARYGLDFTRYRFNLTLGDGLHGRISQSDAQIGGPDISTSVGESVHFDTQTWCPFRAAPFARDYWTHAADHGLCGVLLEREPRASMHI